MDHELDTAHRLGQAGLVSNVAEEVPHAAVLSVGELLRHFELLTLLSKLPTLPPPRPTPLLTPLPLPPTPLAPLSKVTLPWPLTPPLLRPTLLLPRPTLLLTPLLRLTPLPT